MRSTNSKTKQKDTHIVAAAGPVDAELAALDELLQDELLAHARLLADFGPNLGRPTVDTLKGSRHPNMKELRFGWQGGVWRVAFAFDPQRQAILLVGGDKGGADQKRFYRRLIAVADDRYRRSPRHPQGSRNQGDETWQENSMT